MGIFDWLFRKKEKPDQHDAVKLLKAKRIQYIPGQKEPEEYMEYIAKLSRFYKEAHPFSYPIMVVGFDDPGKIEQILSEPKKLKLNGNIKESRIFEQRNPVIKIEYPSIFLHPENEIVIVNDAKALKKIGATDVSAIGIQYVVAEQLRSVYGSKSCVVLEVVIK